MTTLRMSSNWVDGDRFFDREAELQLLRERVENGTHTLLTAQRRMGKTSLVRELLRRLDEDGKFATVFVDWEGGDGPLRTRSPNWLPRRGRFRASAGGWRRG